MGRACAVVRTDAQVLICSIVISYHGAFVVVIAVDDARMDSTLLWVAHIRDRGWDGKEGVDLLSLGDFLGVSIIAVSCSYCCFLY